MTISPKTMEESDLHVSRAPCPPPRRGQRHPNGLHQQEEGAHDPAPGGPPPDILAGLATVGQGHCKAHQLAFHAFHGDQQALDIQTDPHYIPLDLSRNPTYGYKSTSSSPDIFWEHFRDIVVHTVPTSNPDIRHASNGVTDALHELVMLCPYRNKLQIVIAASDLLAAITLITALLPEIQLNTSNYYYLSPTWFNPYNISETIKWSTDQYLYRDMNREQYVQVMTEQLNILTQMIVHKTDLHLTDVADLYMCKFKLTDDQIDHMVLTLLSTKIIHPSQ
jgi:hypothetical protein